ncbi:hypothetical protein GCM10027447_37340 [Glycomyces halotolerans]
MTWNIKTHPAVREWLLDIEVNDPLSAGLIRQAIAQLADEGPAAKRPLVDRVRAGQGASQYHNLTSSSP